MDLEQALIAQAPGLELLRAAADHIALLKSRLDNAQTRIKNAAHLAMQCADHGEILRALDPATSEQGE